MTFSKRVMIEALSFSELPDYRFMGVYYIQNLVTNKFYIGSSADVYSRIKSHLNMLQRGVHSNIPVSYTHLDVYKRQGIACVMFSRI